MASDPPSKRVLLVEGPDDEHVVQHLCNRQLKMPTFAIISKDGFSRLTRAIRPEMKVSGRTVLGILADANDDPQARWQAIAHPLQQVGYNLPARTAPGGIVVEGSPRVGVWLMPDNASTGQLEDFILQMIPAGDPVWPRAKCYIDAIPEAERKFKPQKAQRARIHAWLAARKEPRKMGAAIGAGDLDIATPLAKDLIAWLRQMFG